MLRPINTHMLDDIELTPEQWKKVCQFFSHNMGNALQLISFLTEENLIDTERIRKSAFSAYARFRDMKDFMEVRAGEPATGQPKKTVRIPISPEAEANMNKFIDAAEAMRSRGD